ncbi:putative bifunctional diguanylate cyclase/phosphodiesterase [Methylobacterium dankookense]|uniref:Signaling protein n=1 Tax=Methylobacterium dankookense TaxID=560405 RepID=A0A564FU15_9HYPH|nr:EAL domain-containing protein [Methylobacterium dankookense]GJD56063.1 putative signaling protein [Methylobacterium dankookense]VUF10921.1 putative signaling protein [Methylobacterium dankookense]
MAKRGSWGEGEFYEALCLLMTGACLWIIGAQFHVFEELNAFVTRYGLSDQFMLLALMGFAMFVASLRKSLLLRSALRERDAAARHAESIARHDVLTGLANRRLFLESVERRRAEAGQTPAHAVLLVDLDRFKPVNDIYGHAAGNAVLCAVAERLRGLTPSTGLAARLGGDEFSVLVPLEGGSEGLVRLAQSAIAAISAPVLWNGNELKVGATIGIALISAETVDADAVLHAADLAMYQGKKDGRGTYRVFKSAMDLELKARAQLEIELREAIQRGEIEPFYQPVVSLPEKTLIGVEVLARWRHPTRGLLAPAAFIGIAEETGMISDLSYRLLRQACLDAREWPGDLQIAINISPQQFQDRWLCERILGILTETGLSPRRLEVEITETALVQDLEAARTTLTSLQNLGVRIALDDFGTGYSSLYHLRELKFDKLKIDRSYVDTITMSEERAKLVDAIIKLSASLGLVTTAEGIETDASVDWLSGQGCDFGQGYLFGAPMPKEALTALLQAPSDHGMESVAPRKVA